MGRSLACLAQRIAGRVAIGTGLTIGFWVAGGIPSHLEAQIGSSPSAAPAFAPPNYDESLRDLKYYRYKRVAASGAGTRPRALLF